MSIFETLRIYDNHKKIRLNLDRQNYLIDCTVNKTVLHVGCTDYPITEERIKTNNLLHTKLQKTAKEIIGIDLSNDGIDIFRENGITDVFHMNAEEMEFDKKFDVILAGDVLEHMNNPGNFIQKAYDHLIDDGELIIGVPSALTFNNIRTWLTNKELVHSDHTFYFSPKTLACLCGRYDFLPTKLIFTVQPQTTNESKLYVQIRATILKLIKSMAPSMIMHFKKSVSVDKSHYYVWN